MEHRGSRVQTSVRLVWYIFNLQQLKAKRATPKNYAIADSPPASARLPRAGKRALAVFPVTCVVMAWDEPTGCSGFGHRVLRRALGGGETAR